MCGISGIVSTIWSPASKINKMLEIQSHRGPDAAGFFVSSDGQCALGHNRLSIIDLADHAKQPMIDASGRYHIVFNGEIYNYLELKKELSGYPFKTSSDTEVILAAWNKWGEDCVQKFIGMFAFAIWDDIEKTLTAFRDRLGIKPFHYYTDSNSFIFGSEVKAILAAGIQAEANRDVWGEYLNHGIYDHTEDSFFKNIKILPPGSMLTFQNGKTSLKYYWKLSDYTGRQEPISESAAIDKYLETLFDAVKLRLRSDVPVGVNLSGGLDSSSLLTAVDRLAEGGNGLKSFTVSFTDTQYDEEDFASAVPTIGTWDRSYVRVGPHELWDSIDGLMYHQEAPFGGIGTLSYYKLFESIKKNPVTVVLEGQGVDECLAGYKYYQNLQNRDGNTYQDGTSFLRPECLSKSVRAGQKQSKHEALSGSALNQALYEDMRYNKLPRVLRMNDRLSMAFGKELREPFLDHRLVEFCFSLPDEFKIRNGQGKYLLREAMKKYLPSSILNAHKRAVVTPQREWIKDIFRNQISDLLNSQEFSNLGLFDVKMSKAAFEEYCTGQGDNAFFIWQWLNAASWARSFNVNF